MSNGSPKRREALVEQQEAIRDYLDALLQDIPDIDDEADAANTAVDVPNPIDTAVVSEPAPRESTASPEVNPEPELADIPLEAAPESEPVPADPVEQPDGGDPLDEHREAIQALFFDVGALRLAVPLTELHSVVPWDEVEITPMPHQADWQLGLMRYRNRNVRVIDTVAMVLPPDKRETDEAQANPQHILVVGDGSWGLACHGIGDVIRLGTDEVKWRSRGGKRPWLAGTVIGHLSALIDTTAFARMLAAETGSRRGA